MRLIIVGGVAGGATAAARARRLSERVEIVLFERGHYVSFANCGLPYYIGGEIEDREDLLVATPERLGHRYRIDVRRDQEVIAIDRVRKEVEVKKRQSGEASRERYDKLILSPGARPVKPPLPGVDLPGIFTLRDLPDTDRIKAHVEREGVRSAVVVGGGFIGLEMAENLARKGIKIIIMEMLDQIMPPLDYEMAAVLQGHLRENGITLVLGKSVVSFREENGSKVVETKDGGRTMCDMVILSIGVRPEKILAERAGLRIGGRGGILVDETLRTSDTDIFAIGDAVEVKDPVSGENTLVALAGPANRQGRIAAENALGRNSIYKGTLGTGVVKVFDMTAAMTGNNEKFLKRGGRPYLRSFTHSYHHATYYPGAQMMAVKLLFTPEEGEILGAQVVGGDGADKRIDVLAGAIRAGMTVTDLEDLDLAYAPQFGSAKDAVNIAGNVAANILKGDVDVVHWDELDSLDPEKDVLLDVRTREEVEQKGLIEGALHIHIDDLRDRLQELDREKTYIAYCTVSMRGYLAHRILVQNGFKAKILSGGFRTWSPVHQEMQLLSGRASQKQNPKRA
jgi:NADPH-dependent 2,4-dienoyl-CoA reductase/sulfur reductase-like enzyme/rhodanese-related sulfurtransferase